RRPRSCRDLGARALGRIPALHGVARRARRAPHRARDLSGDGPHAPPLHAPPGPARDPFGDGGIEMKEGHLPVLAEEVVTMLAPASGSLQIDATVGGGGHTERILEATSPDGRLLGLDADGAT